MNSELTKRAEGIIDRYVARKAEYRKQHPLSKEVIAHDAVLSEVPGLAEKIGRAVGEFNDRASDANLRVTIFSDKAPHFSLAIFKITTVGVFDPQLDLSITADHDGHVIGFISGKGHTDRLARVPIAELSEATIFEMILTLVERELDQQRL